MALEAVVYQQQQDLFVQINPNNDSNNNGKFDLFHPLLLDNNWASSSSSSSIDYLQSSSDQIIDDWQYNYSNNQLYDNYSYNYYDNYDYNYPSVNAAASAAVDDYQQWNPNPNSSSENGGVPPPAEVEKVKRRRRARTKKNREEIENQRMTHIAVERNRRKQMNDYLSVLRSFMPDSYVQRGDQASIIAGAINFVKELEQNLQCLSAKKHTNENDNNTGGGSASSLPFGEFFSFPQYSATTGGSGGGGGGSWFSSGDNDDQTIKSAINRGLGGSSGGGGGGGSVAADLEVTMVDNHALLKIRTKRPPKQLSKLVIGLQGLRLTILHLNVSKVDGVALYSFSVKVEDESKLSSVDEIAGAVYQLLGRIEDETGSYF